MKDISTLAIMIHVPYYPLKRIVDSYGDELKKSVCRVVESGWFIRGVEGKNFEKDFAAYCGARFCVGVGNGLEALSLMLKGYMVLGRLQPGDAVIVPSNTFIATWLAVTSAGLVPMPAEPDGQTGVLGLASVEKAFIHAQYSRLKVGAILAVHLYGRLCPMNRLKEFAKDRGLLLLEDAAQAHGASLAFEQGGQRKILRAGNLGDGAGFSFYPGKNLGALGDAGAVVTNDEALAQVVRKLANYGSEEKYVHDLAGENFRRNEIANRYLSEIKNPRMHLPVEATAAGLSQDSIPLTDCVWHIFAVHCENADGSSCRDEVQCRLKELGIETLIHYPTPPHLQKAFVDNYGAIGYPVAEKLAKEELSLPLFPQMTDDEISAVIDGINLCI